jgi:hypothetical protein
MLTLFGNKKKQKAPILNDSQDRIAKSIVITCIRLQQKWAVFMQRHTESLSDKWKAIMLSFFCLSTCGFSLFLITRSLLSNNIVSFQVTDVISPRGQKKAEGEPNNPVEIITNEEYQKIKKFRQFIDSLSGSPSGIKRYDSILFKRPGLIDSAILLESIYQSQIKK